MTDNRHPDEHPRGHERPAVGERRAIPGLDHEIEWNGQNWVRAEKEERSADVGV